MTNNNIQYQTIYSNQIYLNSANADIFLNKTKKSNVVFFFKDALKIERNAIETRISIVDAQIPVSWYFINSSNNQLNITIGYGITTTYTFAPGNYNVSSFITLWYNTVGDNTQWNVTYDSITNKFTFQNLIEPIFYFFDDDNISSILPIIGFQRGSYTGTATGSLISRCHVNFFGIPKLNIKSSTFNLKNVDSFNKGKTRTISSIPVNASSNGIIYYNNFTQYKSIFKNYELSCITLEIQDDFKNYIDFNNCDWSMTLQIDIACEIINNLDTLEDIYANYYQEY